jgi:hypothetical protein
MSQTETTRITALIEAGLAKEFTELTRGIGVSGTALLANTLHTELDYLETLPANTEQQGRKLWRGWHAGTGAGSRAAAKGRFNITLSREDAARLNRLCGAKRVPRHAVINCYVYFLVNGEEGVCEAPLAKIAKLLAEPRSEYEEARSKGSGVDQELYNPGDESWTLVEAVPREHPYHALSWDAMVDSHARRIHEARPNMPLDKCAIIAARCVEIEVSDDVDAAGEGAPEAA